jgi:hypothetical protein
VRGHLQQGGAALAFPPQCLITCAGKADAAQHIPRLLAGRPLSGHVPSRTMICQHHSLAKVIGRQAEVWKLLCLQAVDIWAFGVLLWELYHGARAWAGVELSCCGRRSSAR